MREYLVKATFIRGNALQRYILRSYQTTHSVLTRHVALSSLTTIILPSATHRSAGKLLYFSPNLLHHYSPYTGSCRYNPCHLPMQGQSPHVVRLVMLWSPMPGLRRSIGSGLPFLLMSFCLPPGRVCQFLLIPSTPSLFKS